MKYIFYGYRLHRQSMTITPIRFHPPLLFYSLPEDKWFLPSCWNQYFVEPFMLHVTPACRARHYHGRAISQEPPPFMKMSRK